MVTRKMSPLDYKVDVCGKVKPFHINMLRLYTERMNTDEHKDSNVLAEVSVAIIDIDQEEEEQDRNNSESTEIPSLIQCEQKESFENINLSPELCPEQGTEMKKILQEFPDVFTDLPGKTDLVECDRKLTSTDPVKVKQYPMPYSMMEEVGAKWPVAYASRKLLPREESYATVEKECLALVWSIQKFQRYLYGKHLIVETDHQPLLYLNEAKVSNARLMRWALLLQPYRFTVHAIKDSENVGADYLSRQ